MQIWLHFDDNYYANTFYCKKYIRTEHFANKKVSYYGLVNYNYIENSNKTGFMLSKKDGQNSDYIIS